MRTKHAIAAVSAGLMILLSGCGNGGSSSMAAAGSPGQSSAAEIPGQPSPVVTVHPAGIAADQQTPEDAVYGFWGARELQVQAQACSYVTPATQAACPNSLAFVSQGGVLDWSIGDTVISGSHALVSVVGWFCSPDGSCPPGNDNPWAGMPSNSVSFDQAYSNASGGYNGGSNGNYSPIPCTEIDGQWYIDISF